MSMTTNRTLESLNAPGQADRLQAARLAAGGTFPEMGRFTNNHIHTDYSFSPYSPTAAVWMARRAGLCTAGLMDHDSIGGAWEFLQAAELFSMPVTVGMECRTRMDGTFLETRRINNPDQYGVAYVALHAVPHEQIGTLQQWFAPYRKARGERNRAMLYRLNRRIPDELEIDYDRDVLPISQASRGGSVTERHLLYAVCLKVLSMSDPVRIVEHEMGIPLSASQREWLSDEGNEHRAYDLLGILKAVFVEQFYIDAAEECPHFGELAAFARDHGILLAYAYLGDVRCSVTGDKKDQLFEDSYLDRLISALPGMGFSAVTYMPSRNTDAQLGHVQMLCRRYGLFEISGEDINSPRQSFICPALEKPENAHLYNAAWALIGHENTAAGPGEGMLDSSVPLAKRIELMADAGMKSAGAG